MCHRYKKEITEDNDDDRNVPDGEINPHKIVEPLPESTRPRRDGPGGD